MLQLYHGSGARDFETIAETLAAANWQAIVESASDFLNQRSETDAARSLQQLPFVAYDATNHFGDDFTVILATVPMQQYVSLSSRMPDDDFLLAFRRVARALDEVGLPVRFIAVQPERKPSPLLVPSPSPRVTSGSVERALREAQILFDTAGPSSAVDRAHTAIHAYLRESCDAASLMYTKDANVTELFKVLREQHPAFRTASAHDAEITRILRAVATILDSANTLRNRASGAHPTATPLEAPEAIMVINAVRTLHHYINAKFS